MSKTKESAPRGGFGPGAGRGPADKPKNFKQSMKKLVAYAAKYKIQFVIAIICSIVSAVFAIVGPKMLGNATTELAEGLMAKAQGTGVIDFDAIINILLTLATIYVISSLFNYIQGVVMNAISQKISFALRRDLSKKVNRLPLKYYDSTTQGDVLSRFSNDVDTITTSLQQSLPQLLNSVITLVGIAYMMFTISWILTVVAFIVIPLSMFAAISVTKASQKHFVAQQKSLAKVNSHIEEMYGGHTIVKAYNAEEKSMEKFNAANDDLYDSAWRSQFLSGLMMPLAQFGGNIGYVLVCLVGGYLAFSSEVTILGIVFTGVGIGIGDIQAFIQYVRQFNQPIAQMAQIMNMVQSTAAASERVFEFLEVKEQEAETTQPIPVVDTKGESVVDGSVTFENVRFGYNEDKIIIKNFSMHVKDGQKIAIVGPTGAGKTTIVKLLMRFYELNGGAIYVGGNNIKDYTRADLRSLFGMVLQDTWLFNGSIMDNLRYSNENASDEEVIQAAKVAYVDHFVRTLDEGYNTQLNEDSSNISQGQKQLLTIARAFLANPKVLILDEATSNIDTRTEVLIQKGMDNLMKGRTSFVIAHRLSTIKNADLILVLNEGDIVEVGNHDDLLEKGGFYANLYNAQFEN